jgi:Tat protein secretion system quality control protein TatD with DNase activity
MMTTHCFNDSINQDEDVIKMNTLISITMNLLENLTDIESEFVDIVNDNFWDLI